jgi:RND family efflux transporter MFP subunit
MSTRALGLGLSCVLLTLGGGTIGQARSAGGAKVAVAHPVVRQVSDYEEFTGRIEPAESVEVRARVTGYVWRVVYKPGATVKQGDLLFEIDPRVQQAELKKAEAEVKAADARLMRVTADLDRAKVLMRGRGAISREEFNAIVAKQEETKAAADGARACLTLAQLNLSFTRINAPITGRISRPSQTVGNLVRGDRTPLATLVSVDPVHVAFEMAESTFLGLSRQARQGKAKAAPVQMRLADEEGYPHRGKLDYVDIRVKAATGTVRCQAVFANPDGLLLPGMFARVRVATSAPHKALLIAEQALLPFNSKRGESPAVLVVNAKGVVERRPVKLGARQGTLRVITKGLDTADQVVVEGLKDLRPGATVKPQKVAMPGAAPEKPEAGDEK